MKINHATDGIIVWQGEEDAMSLGVKEHDVYFSYSLHFAQLTSMAPASCR